MNPRERARAAFPDAIKDGALRAVVRELLRIGELELVLQRRSSSARECIALFLPGWRLVGYLYSGLPGERVVVQATKGRERWTTHVPLDPDGYLADEDTAIILADEVHALACWLGLPSPRWKVPPELTEGRRL